MKALLILIFIVSACGTERLKVLRVDKNGKQFIINETEKEYYLKRGYGVLTTEVDIKE